MLNSIALVIGYVTMASVIFMIFFVIAKYRWYKKEVIEYVDDEQAEMSDEEFGEITIDQLIN